MDKYAQVSDRILVYIIGIIVVSVILIFGYILISDTSKDYDDVEDIQFIKEVKNAINSVSPVYGSMKIKEFKVPDRYSEVCFSDTYDSSDLSADFLATHALIADAVNSDKNAFLNGKSFNSFNVGRITIDNHILCADVSANPLRLRIEGLGDSAKLCLADSSGKCVLAPSITCSDNLGCGSDGFVGSLICQGNDVYQNYLTYTCNSPGTPLSSCSSSTTLQLKQSCSAGCTSGSCNSNNGQPQTRNSVQISTCEDLEQIPLLSYTDYYLMSDIDCSSTRTPGHALNNGGKGFNPISLSTTLTIDGNGHKITGLYINRPAQPSIGLFSSSSGEIRNLILEDVDITGNLYVGALSGQNLGRESDGELKGIIENCYVSGTIKGNMYVGGLVGSNYQDAIIKNSQSTGSVSGYTYVGGLVGANYQDAIIKNSHSSGTVTGYTYVGSLVGNSYQGAQEIDSEGTGQVIVT